MVPERQVCALCGNVYVAIRPAGKSRRMVHQHFELIGPLSALENVIVGNEGGGLQLRRDRQTRAVAALAQRFGFELDLRARVASLPMTLWPTTRSLSEPAALPITMISQFISSMPADVEATPEVRLQSAQIASSVIRPSATSPRASATPSADAPREYPIDS